MRRASRFRISDRRCPVCLVPVRRTFECCSNQCSEELEDARTSHGWLRVQHGDLTANLAELEERLGLIQLKLERNELKAKTFGPTWSRLVSSGLFGKANRLRRLALKTFRKVSRLSQLLQPLDQQWKVLKEEWHHSEQELARIEAILQKAC